MQNGSLSSEVAGLKSTGMVKRLGNAVKYSLQGLKAAWVHEAAVRTELIGLAVLVPAACLTAIPLLHKVVLIGSVLMVLVVELLNSALEAVVDLASPDIHPLAGRAKDMGSAAVMICTLFSLGLWCWLAVPLWFSTLVRLV